MKSSVVVSLSATRFEALAFQGKIEERFRVLSELGFSGAELAIRSPKEADLNTLLGLLDKYQLQVPALGTGQAFIEEGLCLTSENRKIRERARERLIAHLELASKLKAYVIIGLIRGVPSLKQKPKAEAILVKELKFLSSQAKKLGNLGLLLEPLNRYETTIINTLEEAMDIIEKVGADNLGILADSFHMNIEETDIQKSIILAKERIWHIHLADSNRFYPGMGHFDFDSLFKVLERIGYKGFVSGEFMPKPNEDEAVKGFAKFLKKRGLLG